jgi:hypothetical protein
MQPAQEQSRYDLPVPPSYEQCHEQCLEAIHSLPLRCPDLTVSPLALAMLLDEEEFD